jgi:hypothetical protein
LFIDVDACDGEVPGIPKAVSAPEIGDPVAGLIIFSNEIGQLTITGGMIPGPEATDLGIICLILIVISVHFSILDVGELGRTECGYSYEENVEKG